MITFLKKYKLAIAVVTIGLVIFVFVLKNRNISSPLPTPIPTLLTLNKTYPPEGRQESAFPSSAILFYFSTALDEANILIEINPNTNFEFDTDPTGKILSIRPLPSWKFNTSYKLKVTVKSKDGQSLGPINYSFTPVAPTNSDLVE